MLIETIPVGALQVNCYVLGCETTRQAIVIDPGDEAEAILAALDQHGLTLTRILATHGHFDHLLACRELQERTGAPFYLHPADRPLVATLRRTCMAWLGYDPGPPPDITGDLTPGETIQAGDIALEVRHTPGHSPGSVTFVDHPAAVRSPATRCSPARSAAPICPAATCARCSPASGPRSSVCPMTTPCLPGHGAASTVGDERRGNPFLAHG